MDIEIKLNAQRLSYNLLRLLWIINSSAVGLYNGIRVGIKVEHGDSWVHCQYPIIGPLIHSIKMHRSLKELNSTTMD